MNIKEKRVKTGLAELDFCKNYQIEVGNEFFEIFTNEGELVVVFDTQDIIKILKNKKLI